MHKWMALLVSLQHSLVACFLHSIAQWLLTSGEHYAWVHALLTEIPGINLLQFWLDPQAGKVGFLKMFQSLWKCFNFPLNMHVYMLGFFVCVIIKAVKHRI